jgi:type I restriction-modification system DNA methylase subunit/REP element-mobilizing transposase RayT
MALFQKTVEQKYLKQLNLELINKKYLEFKAYFGNTDIQDNIRNSKEEQFQEGFLRELFVKLLGYTLNPTPNFNLTTEYKNIKDSKKADGAILVDKGVCPLVKAVIELKGTNTTDLSKIEAQAFGYKNNQHDCVYVITSNFEKLRFYIDNAIEHIEFNLFTLTKADFEILYLCLAFESIEKGIPKKVKDESLSQEDTITKKLYQDYSLFKRELHQNLVALNPQFDSLTLFKKSQKLLDRFLFLFFAEDRQLLPPNSVRLILNDWRELQERDVEIPLYQRFKKFFEYLNTGYKGKRYDVFAYNGGLFKPDDILDSIIIDDELLFHHTYKLSEYNFVSEVDVNILGHIFENSLNELDELEIESRGHAPLTRENSSSSVSKRKKDGVFYTPKYITKYIVENTVGKLCTEKKAELQIIEEEYATMGHATLLRTPLQKKTKQARYDKLKTYQNWLLQLTICDPACGSGAFLNQALDFLINEHRYIDELQAKLLGVPLIFSDIEKSILENNLFGVDLNEESVEIAKLSLWLRTAQPNRKLNDLNNNIKCGNSLISDPAFAGDKAFNWHEAFPQVFRKKEKKGWHITCATHNSRYSQRMFDYHIEVGEAVWLSEKEEIIVIETIAKIEKDDNLNIIACNVCGDHLHLLLVCEEPEVPKIVGKLKSITARECNIATGRTIPTTRGHAPLSSSPDAPLSSSPDAPLSSSPDAPLSSSPDAPLSTAPAVPLSDSPSGTPVQERGTTQAHLWTQKFGKKEITSDEQMENTINYIRNNRKKHGLPELGSGSNSGSQNNGACSLVYSSRSDVCSLVSTMCCSPEQAFRPEYTGGFDVVIGNPPYVQLQSMGEMSEILKNCGYETFDKGADLYCIFTERGYQLLKRGGIQSFIMPNKWMLVAYGKPLRKFLSKTGLRQILNFGDIQFFQEATTYVCIFVTQKSEPLDHVKVLSLNRKTYYGDFMTEVESNIYNDSASKFGEAEWSIQPYNDSRKLEQMKLNGIELKDFPISIYRGILTGYNDAFYIDEDTRQKLIAADAKSAELIKPMVRGRDISAYGISGSEFLINVHNGIKEKNPPLPPVKINDYPAIKKHLDTFYPMLEKRGDKGDTPYNLRNCTYLEDFAKPKIIYPEITAFSPFIYDDSGILTNQKCFILTAQDESVSLLFLTALFNSSLAKLWIWHNCPELQGGTREIRKVYFEHFPVPQANEEQTATLAQYATSRAKLTAELQALTAKFTRTLQRRFFSPSPTVTETRGYAPLSKDSSLSLSIDLSLLSYGDFVKMLGKKKIKLSLSDEAEWEEYFLQESKKAIDIKQQIDTTDKEIDQMVYQLYGLSEVEIKIVEGKE